MNRKKFLPLPKIDRTPKLKVVDDPGQFQRPWNVFYDETSKSFYVLVRESIETEGSRTTTPRFVCKKVESEFLERSWLNNLDQFPKSLIELVQDAPTPPKEDTTWAELEELCLKLPEKYSWGPRSPSDVPYSCRVILSEQTSLGRERSRVRKFLLQDPYYCFLTKAVTQVEKKYGKLYDLWGNTWNQIQILRHRVLDRSGDPKDLKIRIQKLITELSVRLKEPPKARTLEELVKPFTQKTEKIVIIGPKSVLKPKTKRTKTK